MSGRKTPRRIRWAADPMAALSTLVRVRPFDAEESARMSNRARLSWHHLTHGAGNTERFDTLARAMNACLVLSEPVGQPAVDVVVRAQLALVAMQHRYHRQGRFGADAAALADVPPALDLFDQLLSLSNPLQPVKALRESQDRIDCGDVLAPAYPTNTASPACL